MNLLMFVTDDGASAEGTGPALFVRDSPESSLPQHPRGYSWRYFATVQLDDAMLAQERERIASCIDDVGFYVSPRLVYPAAPIAIG